MKLLCLYGLLALLAALAGGALPTLVRLTHTRLQVAVSLVAGLMLGLALLGLLPHATHALGSTRAAASWLLGGFLVMFLLQRFLPFHHHDVAEGSPAEPCGHLHSLAERSARSLSWLGLALGLSVHSVFDGMALAAAVLADQQHSQAAVGLGTALAIILHKPFGALAIATLMAAGNTTRPVRHSVNVAFALITPLGALLFFLGAGQLATANPPWLGTALAFCAGTFLCIACADLLPEVQFHSHDRGKLSLAFVAGVALAFGITLHGHAGQAQHHVRAVGTRASPGDPPRFAHLGRTRSSWAGFAEAVQAPGAVSDGGDERLKVFPAGTGEAGRHDDVELRDAWAATADSPNRIGGPRLGAIRRVSSCELFADAVPSNGETACGRT